VSDWSRRYTYPAPPTEQVYLVRERVSGQGCPECGGEDVRRYPIAAHMGPRIVTKCQACFFVLSLDRPVAADNWPPFRSVTYDWDAAPAERAARDGLRRTSSPDVPA
jgi:hypothetical protein